MISSAYQCICKFHWDPGAPSGTVCQRTRKFSSDNEMEIIRQLKAWTILGRQCDGHAVGDNPHKSVKLSKSPHMTIDDCDTALLVALGEPQCSLSSQDDAPAVVEPQAANASRDSGFMFVFF